MDCRYLQLLAERVALERMYTTEGPLTEEGVRLGTELLQLERRQHQLNNSVIDALKVGGTDGLILSLPDLNPALILSILTLSPPCSGLSPPNLSHAFTLHLN